MKDVYSLFATSSPSVSNYTINSSTSTIIYPIYHHHHHSINKTTIKRKRVSRSSSQQISSLSSTTVTTVTFISRSITAGSGRLFIDDSQHTAYSAKTGLKTAALLGGMLILVIIYLLWKQRGKCRSRTNQEKKFDLDYWLKQVDLIQQKETQNYTKDIFLQLPTDKPRDTYEATATWILDTYKQWRLAQYYRYNSLTRTPAPIHESLTTTTPISKRLRNFLKRRHNQRLNIHRRIRNILTFSSTPGRTLLPLIKIDTSRLDTELKICISKQQEDQTQEQNRITPSISFYDEHVPRTSKDVPISRQNILTWSMYHRHRAHSWPKLRPNHSNTAARAQRIRKRLLNTLPSTSSLTSVQQLPIQEINNVLRLTLVNRPKETIL
ncbi:unnamed protein product [Didymodactylos carnosus]|uniref:Uncharacterized protein n=1 Tax=Didymodactylos carnosus TaxID=1234261 RepID=A0A813SEW4_9BILA|nr:unnamed protein product [Didymodactylos carnosus]CAF0794175.1 unnamed protein product [Didymodactylos carnosus]CAF0862706.1 unnamed protein product [Didymodactylos carnosus]CAF3578564.1 unnamed protein product [Didymodactylos carnosus]CAF3578618.1 unnamed protein product [Didymodactylos carnosus]